MSMRGGMLTQANVKSATVEATITRADGRVEKLGTIAAWHKNPVKRVAHNFWCWIKGALR